MSTVLPHVRPTETRFAERAGRLGTERAFRMAARIAEVEVGGARVIRANLGQPDFPLPAHIANAVERALRDGQTGYCDPQGLPVLRRAIARDVSRSRAIDVDPDRVVVFPGARAPIGFAQQTYCEPGDEVIYPSPGYPLFESFIAYVGARPVPARLRGESGFRLSPDDLAGLLSDRTRLVFLNYPANPTGGVPDEDELEALADVLLADLPPSARVYSDESYEAIVFDGREHRSIASVPGMAERTIIASGVSKTYSWTGGRVGWAVFPTREEARVFTNLNINYFASISPYNQLGAVAALESPESGPAVHRMVEAFQARRDAVVAGLNRIPGIRCGTPRGAFYVFPDVADVVASLGALDAYDAMPAQARAETSPATLLQLFLLHHYHVGTMDRRSFAVLGSDNEHYLRVSIATGLDDLNEAVRRIGEAVSDRAGFQRFLGEGHALSL